MNERSKEIIQHDPLRKIHVSRPPAGILVVYDRQDRRVLEPFRSGNVFVTCLFLHVSFIIDPNEDHVTQQLHNNIIIHPRLMFNK